MTEESKIVVPTEKDLATHKAAATRQKNQVEAMTISSEEDYAKAGDALITVKKVKKEIQSKKDGIIKPMNQALRNTRELFKPAEEKIDSAITIISSKMLEFRKAQEAEAAAKEAELQKQVDQGEKSTDEAATELEQALPVDKTVQGNKGTTTLRKIKDVEITDESQIPRAYLVPDMVKIRATALGKGGNPVVEIPGVKVVDKESIV